MKEREYVDGRRLQRLEEASDWLLRLQAPGRTDAEYDDWLRWCDADPENFACFELVQGTWNDLDALKPAVMSTAASGRRGARRLRMPGRWKLAMGLVAGSAATIALAIGIAQYARRAPVPLLATTLSAPENRAATLPDGSKMILGAASRVSMDFTGSRRQLDLSTGAAYFRVERDAVRPFIVQAGVVSVTAIGTAFDVRRYRDKVTVTVEEGTVEVRGISRDNHAEVWRAEAGYQLVYSTRSRTASLASVDPLIALGWRSGEFAYVHEPLGSVVEDLNRYSKSRIRIDDPEVAALPFTGTAFAASLDGWLAGVEQAYPVEVHESAGGDIVIRRRR